MLQPRVKLYQLARLRDERDHQGPAAHFTILDKCLGGLWEIEQHADPGPARRTDEGMLEEISQEVLVDRGLPTAAPSRLPAPVTIPPSRLPVCRRADSTTT